MNNYKLIIAGKAVEGAQTLDVIDPSTGLVFATAPRASKAQLDEAVAAAKSAFPSWSKTPLADRQKVLLAIAGTLKANAQELAQLLTREQGKPIAETTGEILGSAGLFGYFSTRNLPVSVLEDSDERRVEAHRQPLGVIATIIPWNVPLVLLTTKLAPALLAGNTVVIKPAPSTPLTTLRFAELIKDLLPPGVINVIVDSNDLGAELTSHPDVRKIAFTGSTATGKRVLASAAGTVKRVTMELGGNDAAIVLADVDPKAIAPQLFKAAFQNAGQICMAIKRLYVHADVYDDIAKELSKLADAAVVGSGLQPGTEIGPLQNRMQYEKVRELIEEARLQGRIVAGGTYPDGGGYFIRPTIVRDITDGTRLVDEEQFGPVLPLIKFNDPQEAVSAANASLYGLGASVWSSDIDSAYALANQLEAGTVWVNKHFEIAPNIPYGGAKQSGVGTELGEHSLDEYTQLKVINIAKRTSA